MPATEGKRDTHTPICLTCYDQQPFGNTTLWGLELKYEVETKTYVY